LRWGALLAAMAAMGACKPSGGAPGGAGPTEAEARAAAAARALELPAPRTPARPGSRPRLRLRDSCLHPALAVEGSYRQIKDVIYHEPPSGALRLDLMRPEGQGTFPLVVLIHGGGWVSGRRGELVHEQLMLASQGIASASVDYRLANAPETKFPAAVRDVRCAVRFLRQHGKRFRIDPKRIVAMGPSSGGHLAAMLAAAGDDPRFDDPGCKSRDAGATVQGAVAFYAPLELRPFMGAGVPVEILTTFLGVNPQRRPRRAAHASPVTHLDARDPPFMLVHGEKDILVPASQSRAFKWALDHLGVPALHVEVAGAGHGFFMFKGTDQFRRATCSTVGFIRTLFGLPLREDPASAPRTTGTRE